MVEGEVYVGGTMPAASVDDAPQMMLHHLNAALQRLRAAEMANYADGETAAALTYVGQEIVPRGNRDLLAKMAEELLLYRYGVQNWLAGKVLPAQEYRAEFLSWLANELEGRRAVLQFRSGSSRYRRPPGC